VEAESEAAAELLRLAAFLSPEAIPIEVVITAAAQSIFPAITEHFAEAFAVDETLRETLIFDAWDTLLEPLTRYSLAVKYQERPFPENADAEEQKKWRDETQRLQHTFRVHRLVQAVVREQLGGNRQQIAEQTLSAVSELFPRIENYDKLLPERFLPSALSVVPLVKKFNITSEYSLTLLLSIGSHYIATGKYASAEEFFLQSKDVLYALHTEEKIARISVWNVLANAYFGQAKYEDAELSWLKDLDLKNKYLRSDDPLLCYTLSGLAGIYRIHGKFTQSEKYYKNALIISRLASPNQPLLVASILNNMAELYRYQNRLAEAEPLYIEALSIRISHPPYNHHDIATNRGNLAGLYELTSRFKEAELLYSDALSTLRSLYGYHHPDVGISMNNLAGLYCRQSRFRDAEPLLIESVKVLESVLGRNHPTTKMALQNLEYLFSLKEPKRAD
jgi:tetratricopeptide (TPR) repeat protein